MINVSRHDGGANSASWTIGGVVGLLAMGAFSAAQAQQVAVSADGKITSFTLPAQQTNMSASAKAAAKSRTPVLNDISVLSNFKGPQSAAYGAVGIPHTTRGAYFAFASGAPVGIFPLRATGKLFMQQSGGVGTCTASAIKKGVLVTAAHCVWDYGNPNPTVTAINYEPARHSARRPYGTWTAAAIFVPTVYQNGTDECTQVGVVCANDIAVVVMNKGTGANAGKDIGQVTGWYGFTAGNGPYTNFLGDAQTKVTNITQLGYPGAIDNGVRMIRTDSIGIQDNANQVIIGSGQTPGSSGGPWLINFGRLPVFGNGSSPGQAAAPNRVIGVTSWVSSLSNKLMGSSRFGFNSRFPASGKTNIKTLIDQACGAFPAKC